MTDATRFALMLVALFLAHASLAAEVSESSLRAADSETFERVIEGTAITGNSGIVMGSEIVQPRAGSNLGEKFGSRPLKRRFCNVFENGRWHFLARQASVIESPCT